MTQNLQNQNHSLGGMQWSRTLWRGSSERTNTRAETKTKGGKGTGQRETQTISTQGGTREQVDTSGNQERKSDT